MRCTPLQTSLFRPGQDLAAFIRDFVSPPPEKTVLVITSKILSLAQNRVVAREAYDKKKIVELEADRILCESYRSYLTLKDGHLMPAAGIDESNAEDQYILWPTDALGTARDLHTALCREWSRRDLGLIFTDSRSSPWRRGVTGFSIAHWGFRGLQSHVGKADLFGRPLSMSVSNVADSLASSAVLVMGESDERTPLCLIRDAPISFYAGSDNSDLFTPFKEDIFAPLFRSELFGDSGEK